MNFFKVKNRFCFDLLVYIVYSISFSSGMTQHWTCMKKMVKKGLSGNESEIGFTVNCEFISIISGFIAAN